MYTKLAVLALLAAVDSVMEVFVDVVVATFFFGAASDRNLA
jgi:hypothetical protein